MKSITWISVLVLSFVLTACGGGGGGGDSVVPAKTGSGTAGGTSDAGNTVPVRVSSATSVRNFPLVSVTICQPNSSARANCATIDNVLLDTGSFGLRLYASAIPSATLAALPVQTDTASGSRVGACAAFGSGHTWGSLRNADIKLSQEVAAAVPIQVMSDPAIVSGTPDACVWNTALNSPAVLGANGILGIGTARYDCGPACAAAPLEGYYYADTSPVKAVAMPLARQIINPVALFPVDNNGVIVDMPAVSSRGASAVDGTLTFGIDTQANNPLSGAGATVLATDSYGNFVAEYSGSTAVAGFIDSGSNATFFDDRSIMQYNGFFAPPVDWTRNVVLNDSTGVSENVTVNIGNAFALLASSNFAFNNLTAYMAQTVDLGLPFFLGRRVYYGIDGARSAGGGKGPYVAYMNR
ncbi:DUF3443 family protein [Paraburkholderia sp. J7]|uniref:DUF3443 family protein n=1 Tax=Paraburkholderia sp. J7 TaxID=2805438 RepID=UPI002AB646DD|nr:DUF3443 family protein [Paraburkholderia sp. J7]